MEKRALNRCSMEVSVACCQFSILNGAAMHEGTMLNCSKGGSYIELDKSIDEGTIVMVKSAGASCDPSLPDYPEGFRRVSLAEVRWAKVIEDDFVCRFGVGLKYIQL